MTVDRDSALHLSMRAPAAGSGQRLLPQSSRYRWERQWLNENRGASAAIEGDAHATELPGAAGFSADSARVSAAAAAPPIAAWQTAPATPLAMSPAISAASAAPAIFLSTDGAVASGAVVVAAPLQETTSAAPPLPANRVASAYRPVENRSYALWRHEDEVRLTMRLSEPERDEKSILATLRDWLKQAGLTLRSFTVNGQVRWQDSDAGRSAARGHRSAKNHEEYRTEHSEKTERKIE